MEGGVQIYKSKDNTVQIDVHLVHETIWLNRQQLALLFDRDIKTIGKHINNVFKEGELLENSVVAKFATTASDGKTYHVDFYNLDVIISTGYRVKSKEGTQFRQWANSILKDYLVKGYAINEKRLQQKEQEVKILKQGIQILNRVIEDKADENNWLSVLSMAYNC